MLYDAKIAMRLPGDSPEDARSRLAGKLPAGWTFEITEIAPAAEQPPPVRGTANIRLPHIGVRANPKPNLVIDHLVIEKVINGR